MLAATPTCTQPSRDWFDWYERLDRSHSGRDWFDWYNRLQREPNYGVKVHVYSDPPFNWLHKNCTAFNTRGLSDYPRFKHAGMHAYAQPRMHRAVSQPNLPDIDDYWFAKQAARLLRQGHSVDPQYATVFIVPALLNLCVR